MYMRCELTSRSLRNLLRICFISPRHLSNSLVSRRHQDDRKEPEDKRAGARDVPGRKDNAEVGSVPGKQHLFLCVSMFSPSSSVGICEDDGTYVHVALWPIAAHAGHTVVHVTVIHV